MRSPSPEPVASMIVTWRMAVDAPLFAAIYSGNIVMPAMKTGINNVKARNVRERTRSRYSRLATMRIFLSMARHPRFDAARADALEEDLVQRGLHELEAFDVRACLDQPSQEKLRVGVRVELELEIVVAVVATPHEVRI